MSLTEHLRELRTRLLRSVIALAVGTAVGYAVFPWVVELLIAPYCQVVEPARGDCALIALRPLEPFSVRIRTALLIGVVIAGPVLFHQLWRFVAPGLTRRERRFTWPFVIAAQLLLAAGVAFSYLVIPHALRVLLGLGGPQIEALLSASEYLSFFLRLTLAFALIFELPLVLIALSLAGVLTATALRRARPYAVVGMVTAAAFITPTTDAVTLLVLSLPMWLFYELSVLVAWLVDRRRQRART